MNRDAAIDGGAVEAVLLIGVSDSLCSLHQILPAPRWDVHQVRTCPDAMEFLNSLPVSVAICESGPGDGHWRTILTTLQETLAPPNLIVCSRLADERLWAEVLNLGGYDVLVQPFDLTEVVRVVLMASMDWDKKYRKNLSPSPLTLRAAAS